MDIQGLIHFAQELAKNWQGIVALIGGVLVAFGALLSSLNALIRFFSQFTPWTWDDHLADMIGRIASLKIFQKKD